MAHGRSPRHRIKWQQIISLAMLVLSHPLLALGDTGEIGVDYGLNGDNLPSPQQTVALLKSKGIARVRLYEARQEITKAFANSGIELLLGIPNELVPKLAANLAEAVNWVTQNVVPFPKSGISAIIVGNEWFLDPSHDPALLLPAMLNVYTVLRTTKLLTLNLRGIKVSTSYALNVLGISFPPSAAQFDTGILSALNPILDFLEQTGSFFMVNIFPYFAYVDDPNVSLEFALFEAKEPVQDPRTKLNYTNLFDLQLDAVYAALDSHAALTSAGGRSSHDDEFSAFPSFVEEDDEEDGDVDEDDAALEARSTKRTYRSMPHQRRGSRTSGRGASSRSGGANHRRPRVVVGESGWPSGSGDSGSVPHSQLQLAYDDDYQEEEDDDEHHARLSAASPPPRDVISSRQQWAGDDVPADFRRAARDRRQPPSPPAAPSGNVVSGRQGGSEGTWPAVLVHREAGGAEWGPSAATASSGCNIVQLGARVCSAATVENARTYNQNLIRHVLQVRGTPANPTTPIHAYIFALFDEDLKPPGPEQHYGLFFPNATPVYPITFH